GCHVCRQLGQACEERVEVLAGDLAAQIGAQDLVEAGRGPVAEEPRRRSVGTTKPCMGPRRRGTLRESPARSLRRRVSMSAGSMPASAQRRSMAENIPW